MNIYILTLLKIPGVGKKTAERIIENSKMSVGSDKDIYERFLEEQKNNKKIPYIDKSDWEKFYNQALSLVETSEKSGISIVSKYENRFPKKLINIPNNPILINYKGNIDSLNKNVGIAVIGTREPTEFGIKAGYRLTKKFVENGFSIISGLAVGCDTIAHRACLDNKGITVAVLASGLDYIYPRENVRLANEILEKNGCLISEYECGIKPRPNYFVERDRLQSGLADAVVIIETDINGGTMHTVRFAEEQNKKIGCIDHPLENRNHPKTNGNRFLINENKAKPLSNKEDVIMFIKEIRSSEYIAKVDEDAKKPKKLDESNLTVARQIKSKKKGKKTKKDDDRQIKCCE